VKDAFGRFIVDCGERNLRWETVRKYRLLEKEMVDRFGLRPIDSVGVDDLSDYRGTWSMAPHSAQKKIERLRVFFRFCVDRGWIDENPAALVKLPRFVKVATLPFTEAEIGRIMKVIEKYPDRPPGRRLQVKAFVNVLRFSGLRIGDVTTLSRNRILEGSIFLYSHKTGVPVRCPLPDHVVEELGQVNGSSRFILFRGVQDEIRDRSLAEDVKKGVPGCRSGGWARAPFPDEFRC